MVFNEEYITKKNDKYIVHRKFNGLDYKFGEFDNPQESIEFRDNLDADGWPLKKDTPLFSSDGKKPILFYIKEFISNQIIYLNRNVKEDDPSISTIYRKFKENLEEDANISLKSFKYFFPRHVNKEHIIREQINGTVRYNISFVNDLNKKENQIEKEEIDNNIKNKQLKELHGSIEIIPRLEEFINKKIVILDRETIEDDPILDDIHLEFNEYLKKYKEKTKLASFSNYFSTCLSKNKKANKLIANGKTHYNILIRNKEQTLLDTSHISKNNDNKKIKNIKIKYKIEINTINEFSIINIKGKVETEHFEIFLDQIKKLKNNFISLNIEQQNNFITFQLKIIEKSSRTNKLLNFIDSIFF